MSFMVLLLLLFLMNQYPVLGIVVDTHDASTHKAETGGA
jgi:hypothetical protein